jgi:hypothetical protein
VTRDHVYLERGGEICMDRMSCKGGALTRCKKAEKLMVYSEFGVHGPQRAYVGRVGEEEGRCEVHGICAYYFPCREMFKRLSEIVCCFLCDICVDFDCYAVAVML